MLNLEELDRAILFAEGFMLAIITRIFYKEILPDIIEAIKLLLGRGREIK